MQEASGSILVDALNRIVELATPVAPIYTDQGGRTYVDREQKEVRGPLPARVKVVSLSGLRDLVAKKLDSFRNEEFFIHVENHNRVAIKKAASDVWGRRLEIIEAVNEEGSRFTFGKYHSQEEFMIALQAAFVANDDLSYLIQISSKLTDERVVQGDDNGITQTVAVRKGAALSQSVTLKPRVTLKPFRTFREADQPASEFIFRVQQAKDGGVPTLALFEADGGKWKLDAMQNIAYWLRDNGIEKDIAVVF